MGLDEALDPDYLRYRIRSTAYLGEKADAAGVPTVRPPGGHAMYLDARAELTQIPASEYPARSLDDALYLVGGVRGVEIGSVMFGSATRTERRLRRPWSWCGWHSPPRLYAEPRGLCRRGHPRGGGPAGADPRTPHRGAGALAAALHREIRLGLGVRAVTQLSPHDGQRVLSFLV